jgi:hypothetical protein
VKIFVAIFVGLLGARADALSLPLEGYFHPGRAMPVKWDVGDSGSNIEISEPGAIASRARPGGNPWGVFPWIVVQGNSGEIGPRGLGLLKPVEESDLIVVNTITQDVDVTELFPRRRVILLQLDADDLAGPAMAWESVDAILLRSASLAKMPPELRDSLFAQGVELAVMGGAKPDGPLPWVRAGDWWTASAGLHLPPAICADAYTPTLGWKAGRSVEFRGRVVFLGIVYCLVILGVSLLRWRWTGMLIVVVSIAAAGVFAVANRGQSPIFSQSGIVRIGGETLEDDWLFQVSHRRSDFSLALSGGVHPVFYDESQIGSESLVLDCDQNGRAISISGTLSADDPLALMRRRVRGEEANSSLVTPATSPLRLLVNDAIYPGFGVVRQVAEPANDGSWPTIVIERSASRD